MLHIQAKRLATVASLVLLGVALGTAWLYAA
jgi:hypothetical protein